MKNLAKVTLFVCIFVFCGHFPTMCAEISPATSYKKQYVNHKSVKVTNKGIFVTKNGQKISVKKLYTDKNGRIYYKMQYFTKGYTQSVPCPNGCGWFWGRKCPKCGWPEKNRK